MDPQAVLDWLTDEAAAIGAEYPMVEEASDGNPVVIDTASGRTWKIRLEEF